MGGGRVETRMVTGGVGIWVALLILVGGGCGGLFF